MATLEINNGLCVVCNDKRYRPYASTCKKCYDTTKNPVITALTDIASKKANDDLKKKEKMNENA